MVDKRKVNTKDKWKEKSWYTVVAPSYFGEKEIALTPGSDPRYIINRTVAVPVSEFTGNFKKSSSMVLFKIDNCIGKKCSTVFIGHKVSDDAIRRMVRRRRERIDIITAVTTKDLYKIVVKIVLVADNKLTGTKRAEVRATVVSYISDRAANMKLSELALYLIGDDIYNDISDALKDIYPIKKIEIRRSEVEGKSEQTVLNETPVE
ncbi:30S ribosomal protein S3ae [Acidiplasma aeolicum]|nr:30S ribosomal protein S3ae [Acidiplasma aeolicum]KQB36220.1 30S ribosomal protein S3Ae [Acidiplasma aeolicum]